MSEIIKKMSVFQVVTPKFLEQKDFFKSSNMKVTRFVKNGPDSLEQLTLPIEDRATTLRHIR